MSVRAAVRRAAQVPRRRRGLARLDARGDRASAALASAARAAEGSGITEAEQAWIDRIEVLRAELMGRDEPVTVHAREYSGDDSDERVVVEPLGELCRVASKPPEWSRFLMRLVSELRPASALELGTCLGLSAAYQAAGLRLAGGGRLVTMEAAEARVDLSRAHLARLGLDDVEVVRGRFAATLDGVLERIAPVDYAFVDGHHDEQATLDYVERITAVASPGAVLVVDDVRWSDGMARAWSRIAEGERVGLAADLGNVGVVVLGGAPRERVAVPLG